MEIKFSSQKVDVHTVNRKKIAETIMAELDDKDKIDMKESSPNAYSIYTVASVF